MALDALDQRMAEVSGKAKNILIENIGLDVSDDTAEKYLSGIRHWLRYKATHDLKGGLGVKDSWEGKADGSAIASGLRLMSETDGKDPVRVMELMGLDPLQWTLIDFKVKYAGWDVTMRMRQGQREDGSTRPDKSKTQTNYAYNVECRVKPIQDMITSVDLRQILEEIQVPELINYNYNPGDLLLELGLIDPHLGEMIDGEQTGDADWDLEIAIETYKFVVLETLARVRHYRLGLERIILQIGQDFFNLDNKAGTTTKGTPQDNDGSAKSIFRAGADLLVWAVETLRAEAPVELVYVPGNHDEVLSYSLAVLADKLYKDIPGVEVDLRDLSRKYIQHGICLIGLSHGTRIGKRIQDMMQSEVPDLWGKTTVREMHLGHLHHEEASEEGGITVRRLPSITPRDKYEEEMGYMGVHRRATSFIWSRTEGLEMILPVTILGIDRSIN